MAFSTNNIAAPSTTSYPLKTCLIFIVCVRVYIQNIQNQRIYSAHVNLDSTISAASPHSSAKFALADSNMFSVCDRGRSGR